MLTATPAIDPKIIAGILRDTTVLPVRQRNDSYGEAFPQRGGR